MVARVGAAQLNRYRWVYHNLATALARAHKALILYAARHATTRADSHQPVIVHRNHLADDPNPQLHSLGANEYEACCCEMTTAAHPEVRDVAPEQGL